ncbi:hypothetical protein QBC43DRAFT_323545 [Cladorrhinum sp. PSN259]|nr:hypothetical protein QBC43DRAFT_323545 [Cladorrhinum sp. PSN259]
MPTSNQEVEASGPVAPPRKKLPFKKRIARSVSPGVIADSVTAEKSDDDDLGLFRRSKEVYNAVLRKAEEERQASLTPDKSNRKRKSSSDEDSSDLRHKRHQSSSSSMRHSPTLAQPYSALDDSDDEIVLNKKGKGKEVIRTPECFTPRKLAVRQTPSVLSSPVVVIDDSDDDDDDGGGVPIDAPVPLKFHRTANSNPHDSSRDSSPIEIINKRDISAKDNDDDDDDDSEEEKKAEQEDDNMEDEWARKAMELRRLNEQETVIFMVTSRWPNTQPIKAKRRLVQSLAIVLETWMMKQRHVGVDLPDSEMFATWKGQKIYTHTSLASLGIRVDETGRPRCSAGEAGYYFDDAGLPLGVHLEVWDEELYNEYLERKNRERAVKLGVLDEEYAAESERESPEPEPKKRYKVILKAKELEPLRMAVMDNTTVEFMIDAFCQQRSIPDNWDIAIYFDGEKLDEHSLVVDADIDPDETNQFEVHIKK